MLVTTDAVGGVWRYAVDLASGLAEQGIRPVLAVLGPDPSPAQAAEASGIQLMRTGLPLDWTAERPAALATASAALAGLAAECGASSIHLHAPALVGNAAWPAPVVVVAHSCVATWWQAVRGGALPPDFQWRTALAASGLQRAAAVIAPTAAHADAVQDAYGALPIRVVHNGSTRDGHAGARPPRPAASVLTAGRLWDEAKNAAALDRAAAALDAPIRAAGPVHGPNGATVTLHAMHLLGTLDRAGMARAYEGAAVFASLARYEPFGLAVLEAAQCGLRLVLSDIPSFRELWDGAATFVANDAEAAGALRAALEAEGDGGAQARAARYTVAAMVQGTLDVHRAVAA